MLRAKVRVMVEGVVELERIGDLTPQQLLDKEIGRIKEEAILDENESLELISIEGELLPDE